MAGGVDPAVIELRSLAEFPEAGKKVYVVAQGPSGEVIVTAREVDEQTRYEFPFRRPSGPRSPQVGPVMKRSYNSKEKSVGPKPATLRATLASFETIAASNTPVSRVYAAALAALGPGTIAEKAARLCAALESMAGGDTVFFSVGPPPGNDAAYAQHLLGVIRAELYGIDDDAKVGVCPVCGTTARLGSTALKGAKINFLNSDDHGVFPGLDADRAAARFSLCAACADGIASCYIQRKAELGVVIAGTRALLLPHVIASGDAPEAARSALDVLDRARAAKGTSAAESDLLDALAEERALAAFHILWATAGDALDDVTGFITDVPCTRLGVLSQVHLAANRWSAPVFPARRVCELDLRLSLVGELLRHPGGDRTKRRSKGAALLALRQRIARAVYLGARLHAAPLMRELRDILADHLVDPTVEDRFVVTSLTREPPAPKKADSRIVMNAASWIRHAALLLHYLRHLEVLEPMATTERYAPRSDRLQKLLAPASGVDTDAKMFAFFVGALFGWLLIVQGAKGVNVRSNALTWLRRGTLAGGDLPGLYVRIREKFMEYGHESKVLREVVLDTSALGARLGTSIPLDADTTMYFLFLGQALAAEVFGKDDGNPSEKAPS